MGIAPVALPPTPLTKLEGTIGVAAAWLHQWCHQPPPLCSVLVCPIRFPGHSAPRGINRQRIVLPKICMFRRRHCAKRYSAPRQQLVIDRSTVGMASFSCSATHALEVLVASRCRILTSSVRMIASMRKSIRDASFMYVSVLVQVYEWCTCMCSGAICLCVVARLCA